tara:strand:- start:421 stop:795 length:375 start_codon:yes stop_codon:yes gene_type:complete
MKFSKDRIVEIIKEEMDRMDHSHHKLHDKEGKMAKSQLYQLARYSAMLHDALEEDDQLEAWVQSKITKAMDYISKVKHYLEYEMNLDFDEPDVHLEKSMDSGCGPSPQMEPKTYVYEVADDFDE